MGSGAPLHIVIVGSAPVQRERLRRLSDADARIICADGGADAVLEAGLKAEVVLGDMDSISPSSYARIRSDGTRLIEHPVEKDKTDLELALDEALALEPSRVTILGAIGGERLDHTLGNIFLLAQPRARTIDVRLEDEHGATFVVWDKRVFCGSISDYVSLMPFTAKVEHVVTMGLRYQLNGDTLVRGSTRGISNELIGEQASIEVKGGCLLVRHEHRAGL